MGFICNLVGHKWETTLNEVPDGSTFHRIDCARCDFSVDGAKLKQIRDAHPEIWERVKGSMP